MVLWPKDFCDWDRVIILPRQQPLYGPEHHLSGLHFRTWPTSSPSGQVDFFFSPVGLPWVNLMVPTTCQLSERIVIIVTKKKNTGTQSKNTTLYARTKIGPAHCGIRQLSASPFAPPTVCPLLPILQWSIICSLKGSQDRKSRPDLSWWESVAIVLDSTLAISLFCLGEFHQNWTAVTSIFPHIPWIVYAGDTTFSLNCHFSEYRPQSFKNVTFFILLY